MHFPFSFWKSSASSQPPSFSHIIITGQSLAAGTSGVPVVSTVQDYGNLMFVGGVRAGSGELDSLIPLVATINGEEGETIANGMADTLASQSASRLFLVSDVAVPGARYEELAVGTAPFNLSIEQAIAAKQLLPGSPEQYTGVLAVVTCHGETDQGFSTPDYAGKLGDWQTDYQAALETAVGQIAQVPLLVYQQTNLSPFEASSASVATALESLRAHEEFPGRVVLVGPDYSWVRNDGVHLTANGYRSMALMYARVLKVIRAGGTWNPLMPVNIVRTGAVIDLTYHVPSPPLSLDLVRVFNPGNYGFSYTDDDSSAAVQSVELVSTDTVRVTLDGPPTGANKLIRYGWRHTEWAGGGPKGPLSSARGNLRDAGDEDPNLYGYAAYNWGVLFNKSAE